jgi:SOUL heme-binding protein
LDEIHSLAVASAGGTFQEAPVILKLIVVPVVLFGAWIFGGYLPTRNIAMPSYAVLEKKPGYEIRRYDRYVLAETAQGDEGGSKGFNRLFRYISGKNAGGSHARGAAAA